MGHASIDVDRHPQLAQEHQVRGIPDVRLWQGGREVARFTGYRDRAAIAAWVDQHAKAD
jgi:thioredoxin-like negative regulator of GroEL